MSNFAEIFRAGGDSLLIRTANISTLGVPVKSEYFQDMWEINASMTQEDDPYCWTFDDEVQALAAYMVLRESLLNEEHNE